MLYITFGESPSGVYKGQIIDVCQFLSEKFNIHITLITFVSIRNFLSNRKKIKSQLPSAIVVPMTPKARTWKLNVITLTILCLFKREKVAICRNTRAANLALMIKKIGLLQTICYDGRGAVAAEYEEYLSQKRSDRQIKTIKEREITAVKASDFRIAVSKQLVKYWKQKYNYNSIEHVIIPCTLNKYFSLNTLKKAKKDDLRAQMGFDNEDIVFVYSGSTAGWQSFDLLNNILEKLLSHDPKFKVLFLSKEDKNMLSLKKRYPRQVCIKWVKPQQVSQYLEACDYGLLIREPSMTNKVAAPTKFAEYLISGLPVIISENVGDYSCFVKKNKCGVIFESVDSLKKELNNKPKWVRKRIKQLGRDHFFKKSDRVSELYRQLLQNLL